MVRFPFNCLLQKADEILLKIEIQWIEFRNRVFAIAQKIIKGRRKCMPHFFFFKMHKEAIQNEVKFLHMAIPI